MDQGQMVDDSSVSDIYTTDGGNKDEFRMDQEDTLKQMKHLLDSTLMVRKDEGDHDDNMSDINDGNESILSDNALFRAEVEAEERRIMAEYDLGPDFEKAVSKPAPAPPVVLKPRSWFPNKSSGGDKATKEVPQAENKQSPVAVSDLSPAPEESVSKAESVDQLATPEPSVHVPQLDEAAEFTTPVKTVLSKKPSSDEVDESGEEESLPSESLDSGLARRLQVISDSDDPPPPLVIKTTSPDRTEKTYAESPDYKFRDPEMPPMMNEQNRPPSLIIIGGPFAKDEIASKPLVVEEEERKGCFRRMTEDKLGRLVLVLLFILVVAVAVAVFSLVKYGRNGVLQSQSSREGTSNATANATEIPPVKLASPQPTIYLTQYPTKAPEKHTDQGAATSRPSLRPAAAAPTASPVACVDDPSAIIYINSDYGNRPCSWLPGYPGHRERLCVGSAQEVCCASCALDPGVTISAPVAAPAPTTATPTKAPTTKAPTTKAPTTKAPVESSPTSSPTAKVKETPKPTSKPKTPKPTPAPVKDKPETPEPTIVQDSFTSEPTIGVVSTSEPTKGLDATDSPTADYGATLTDSPTAAVGGAAQVQSVVGTTIRSSANGLTLAALSNSGSAQSKALKWVEDNVSSQDALDIKQAFGLATMAYTLNYQQWSSNDGWLASANVCSWSGISCTNGAITEMNLRSNGVKGKIPVELSYAGASLVTLDLGENNVLGKLPYSLWAKLPQLQELLLDNNSLKGKLPTSIGSLDSLQSLQLQYNSFSGPVPSSLSKLSKLSKLYLWHNDLTGELPSGICDISGLNDINLDCREIDAACWTTCAYQCGGATGITCDPNFSP